MMVHVVVRQNRTITANKMCNTSNFFNITTIGTTPPNDVIMKTSLKNTTQIEKLLKQFVANL